ncbi:hypothetical protein PF007_g30984 [Phytophthora fragariae]|uniref:Uncharacterized protein n=1 Tax=Phytophthora fragariae TaxID=53985 RepID=A0A6A3PJ59_9STRA|nr:hypothetical protein PF007_g30984 [Phytophthora fragariae]
MPEPPTMPSSHPTRLHGRRVHRFRLLTAISSMLSWPSCSPFGARRSSLGLPRLHGRNARCWSRRCDVRRDGTVVVLAVRLWACHDCTGVMLAVGLAAVVSAVTARSSCSP